MMSNQTRPSDKSTACDSKHFQSNELLQGKLSNNLDTSTKSNNFGAIGSNYTKNDNDNGDMDLIDEEGGAQTSSGSFKRIDDEENKQDDDNIIPM